MSKKQIKVKAFIVYSKTLNDVSDSIFETKTAARNELRSICYRSNSLFMKIVLKNYKIIPCTISYSLPPSNKKKK